MTDFRSHGCRYRDHPGVSNILESDITSPPRQELKRIVDLQLDLLRARLAERNIEIDLTEAAKEHIAREGYDPVYGARPMKRFLQRRVETPLSRKLISGEITDGSHISVEYKAGELTFKSTELNKIA